MQIANSHRNHNIATPHAVGPDSLIIGGTVHIDGRRRLVKQQGAHENKFLGFIAETCQARYRSNAKTTSNNHASSIHGEERTQRVPLPFALSLSKGPLNRARQPDDDDPPYANSGSSSSSDAAPFERGAGAAAGSRRGLRRISES